MEGPISRAAGLQQLTLEAQSHRPSTSGSSGSVSSPPRPAKSDRRRSSTSLAQLQSLEEPQQTDEQAQSQPSHDHQQQQGFLTLDSPSSPVVGRGQFRPPCAAAASARGGPQLNLATHTSLSSIEAGSTPVSPLIDQSTLYASSKSDMASYLGNTYNADGTASTSRSSSSSRRVSPLQRQSTADILASTLESYHLDRSHDSASASSHYSRSQGGPSVPPSPSIFQTKSSIAANLPSATSPRASPVATFTAGMQHNAHMTPAFGPLKIESTTGSKNTVIKDPKRKKSRSMLSSSSRNKPGSSRAYTGGISSEDIFSASASESNDDGAAAAGGISSPSRRRTLSLSSSKRSASGRRAESPAGGGGLISSSDEAGLYQASSRPTSPLSPTGAQSGPGLTGMFSNLRRKASRSMSGYSSTSSVAPPEAARSPSRNSLGRANSHNQSEASASASASEQESVTSESKRAGSTIGGASPTSPRNRRGSKVGRLFKRRTSAEDREEQEQLRVLAELRLKALALASGDGDADPTGVSAALAGGDAQMPTSPRNMDKENAELLVRDMQRHRAGRHNTADSIYSDNSAAYSTHNDDTVTSGGKLDSQGSLSHMLPHSPKSGPVPDGSVTGMDTVDLARMSLYTGETQRPEADVPLDAEDYGSDGEANMRQSFMDVGRRATLMPSSSQTSLNEQHSEARRLARQSQIPFEMRRSASTRSKQSQGSVKSEDSDDRRKRETVLAENRRRSTVVPRDRRDSAGAQQHHHQHHHHHSHRRAGSFGHSHARSKPGTEADDEDEQAAGLASSLLEKRRSTIKPDGIPGIRPGSSRSSGGVQPKSSTSSLGSRSSRASAEHLPSLQNATTSFSFSPPATRASHEPAQSSTPARPRNASLSSSQSLRDIGAEVLAPPVRSSSRPDSPSGVRPGMPSRGDSQVSLSHRLAESRLGSFSKLSGDGDHQLPKSGAAGLGGPSSHMREGADGAISPGHSPTSSNSQLPGLRRGQSADRLTSDVAVQASSAGLAASRQGLNFHRRSSSDALAVMAQRQRPSLGHHRRTSSTETASNKALPHRPISATPQSAATLQARQEQQRLKLSAVLGRNKPLPPAISAKEDISKCRSAGDRALVYARKINELSIFESGLSVWLMLTRSQGTARLQESPPVHTNRRASLAPSATTSYSGTYHPARDDNYSEAAFPLRRGSQDVYKARDITQRAPSVAPSTMVPNNIPYPGVYEDSQTLRTTSALSHYSSTPTSAKSQFSGSSLASAALTAAGLPGKVGFFGLGRKVSKRSASGYSRPNQGVGTMSISSPIQAPQQPMQQHASGARSVNLRPTGPRPSISLTSSDRDAYSGPTLSTSASMRSLSAIPQGNPAPDSVILRPQGSPLPISDTTHDYEEGLQTMMDVIPQAAKEVLLQYLVKSKGDHLTAIGAYFEDERRASSR